jgi:tartrate dehydratase alpha subunit/fumarate hydratase class I-like protein
MRVVFIQFAGDYAEAYIRLKGGGPETNQAQKYSVDYVENLSKSHEFVATRSSELLTKGAPPVTAADTSRPTESPNAETNPVALSHL